MRTMEITLQSNDVLYTRATINDQLLEQNAFKISSTRENKSCDGRPKRKQNGIVISSLIHRKWLVLIGSFYGILFSSGLLFNMSVLYVEFLDEFQKTKADTSLIQAVCMGVFSCSGLVTGLLVNKFGERMSLAVGAIIAASGIGSSFLANGIPFLVCSIGIVAGFGFSMVYISSYSIAPKYFSGRKRFLALGFISIASGVGGLSYPVVLERLLVTYHWREILLTMSGLILNIVVFSMIGHPCHFTQIFKIEHKSEPSKLNPIVNPSVTGEIKETRSPITTKLKEVLSNMTFMCFAIGMMLSLPCFNSIAIFFIDFFEYNGVERSSGVWLYSGMSIASTISRPLPGIIAQNSRIPKLAIPAFFIVVGIVVMFLYTYAKSIEYLAVLSIIFGLCYGVLIAVLPVNVFHIIGQKNYATAFGTLLSGCGLINIVGGPALGFFRDLTGSYDTSFYVSCGILSCSLLLLLISHLCIKAKTSSKRFQLKQKSGEN